MNKVMIGVATYNGHSYCRPKFIDKLKVISKGHEVIIVWNSSWKEDKQGIKEYEQAGFKVISLAENKDEQGVELLARKQNVIRDCFLKSDCSHLLMLESDNIVSDGCIDQLLEHDVEVVTGLYFVQSVQEIIRPVSDVVKQHPKYEEMGGFDVSLIIRQCPIPTIWGIFGCEIFENMDNPTSSAMRCWTLTDYIDYQQNGHRLVPIFAAGVGCVLFSRSVIELVPFRSQNVEDPNEKQLTDFIWYHEAWRHGITSYVDIQCLVQHYHRQSAGLGNFSKWFRADTMERKVELE